jgi:hypothetical protein
MGTSYSSGVGSSRYEYGAACAGVYPARNTDTAANRRHGSARVAALRVGVFIMMYTIVSRWRLVRRHHTTSIPHFPLRQAVYWGGGDKVVLHRLPELTEEEVVVE